MFGRLTSLALVLTLITTSAAMALARVQPGPAGVMVICAGTTVQTVHIDADGQPMAPPHPCPECIFGAALIPDGVRFDPVGIALRLAVPDWQQAALVARVVPQRLVARGPPARA